MIILPLSGIVLLGASYSIIPTYYHKLFNPKVIRKISGKKQIVLTFDDGPDPRYTGKLLDLLCKEQIHATFFVVAKKAQQYPQLVERMINEGHEVGLHSYEHANALFKGYQYTKSDFENSMHIIKQHGWKIRFFRPPWGHCNLFTSYFAKQHKLTMVTWNVMAQDWKKSSTDTQIALKLMNRIKDGSVICLHDAGKVEQAPEQTLKALTKVLPYLKRKGYCFRGLDFI